MQNKYLKKALKALKALIIIWLCEFFISTILYSFSVVFGRNYLLFIIYLNIIRFIYYYLFLFIIYTQKSVFTVKFLTIINLITFLIISIAISLLKKGTHDLFLDYSFLCNLLGIILTPFILKLINNKLPIQLRIY